MERRQYPRVPYGAWVEDQSQESGLQFYMAENLSMGGLLLKARGAPPPLGHNLRLRLVIENEARVMTVEGQVVRHVSHEDDEIGQFAVRFVNMDPVRMSFVRELVSDLSETE